MVLPWMLTEQLALVIPMFSTAVYAAHRVSIEFFSKYEHNASLCVRSEVPWSLVFFSLAKLSFSFFQLWATAKVRIFLIFRGLLCAAPRLMIQGGLSLWFLPPFMFLCLWLTESFNLWLPFIQVVSMSEHTHVFLSEPSSVFFFVTSLTSFCTASCFRTLSLILGWIKGKVGKQSIQDCLSVVSKSLSSSMWPKSFLFFMGTCLFAGNYR